MERVRIVVRFFVSLSCVACLLLQCRPVWSDEPLLSKSAASAGFGQYESATESLPAVPYRVLNEALSEFGGRVIVLTDEQKRAVGEIQNGQYKIPMLCSRLRTMTLGSQPTLLDTAIKLIEQNEEDKAAHRILAVLSKEQISEIRAKKRGAILQAESQRATRTIPKLTAYKQTMYSIGGYMLRNDLLSLLEGTDAMDVLQLSDEQFDSVQKIREQAWPQALITAKECVELLQVTEEQKQQNSQTAPADGGPAEKILEKTMAVLTEEQQVAYQARSKQRLKELQENPPKDPLDMMAAFRQHAMPEEIRTETRNGHSQISIRLFNYFAVPENAKALNISGEQQEQIAALLHETERAAEKSMTETHTQSQGSDAETNARINEIVNAFHKKNFDAVFALPEKQTRILQEKKLQQLGIEALRLPEVRSELNLTEIQAVEIDAILNRPMSQQNYTTVVSDSEARKLSRPAPKTQEESIKQFEEHRKQFDAQVKESQKQFRTHNHRRHQDIWNLLTEEQRATLTTQTGVSAPVESKLRI